jgi:putative transcriptional regulator
LQEKIPSCAIFFLSGRLRKEGMTMIKCHLSRMLGEKKLKIADVARDIDVHRGTITRLYQETASRIELDVIDRLCRYLGCTVGELFEYQENEEKK